MGAFAAIRASCGMKKMGREGVKEKGRAMRIFHTHRSTLPLLFFALFACFAGNSFSQDLDRLSKAIRSGSVEQKRNALYEIRNLQTESASRIAIPALSDPEAIVRATAAASIAFLPETEAAILL